MTTTGLHRSWFDAGDPDRTHLYFSDCGKRRPSGTVWEYDSAGSQVLCALVERVSKKSLFDFLNERIFTHLGTFKNARILKTPNGDSWGDSAMICTPRDLASFARFVMSYGVHKGKRLMNENYLKTATSPVVNNKSDGFEHMMYHGYGYQFWITEEEGFAFVGMGDQLAICVPKYDFIFVCTADNQGNEISRDYIVSRLFDYIISNLSSSPLCESRESSDRLSQLTNSLALYSARESNDSPMRKDINERTYIFEENPMSLEKICFRFDTQSEGKLIYTRDGREMELEFYVNKNRFGLFPELSYSDQVGGVKTQNGHKYKDAVSFTWLQDNKILVLIQIIDNYFGNASLVFSFKDDYVVAQFSKTAEDFLHGYCGTAIGKAE